MDQRPEAFLPEIMVTTAVLGDMGDKLQLALTMSASCDFNDR
jgi:hypothetical protein